MKAKAAAGIAGIGIVIIIGVAFAITQSPSNIPEAEIIEEQDLSPGDTPGIEESVTATKGEANYIIDEEGNKKYVISASDDVEVEE